MEKIRIRRALGVVSMIAAVGILTACASQEPVASAATPPPPAPAAPPPAEPPAPPPAAAPAQAPSGQTFKATASLILRSRPSIHGRGIGRVHRGETLQSTDEERGGWQQVQAPGGKTGWVPTRFLRPAD